MAYNRINTVVFQGAITVFEMNCVSCCHLMVQQEILVDCLLER